MNTSEQAGLYVVDPIEGPDELQVHLATRAVDRHALDDDDFVMLLEMLLGPVDCEDLAAS